MNEAVRPEADVTRRVGSGRAAFFDVFETLLVRSVAAPTDLFRLLHAELAASPPGLPEGWDEDLFAIARVQAEREARVDREECTLAQIWDCLAARIPGLDREAGMAAELRLEAACLQPVPQARAELEAARRAGDRIAFLSDTYLPESFLRAQLERAGCLRPGDHLFASSTHGVTKTRGGLYRLALDTLGVKPAEARMLGDNPHADVKMARRSGLAARRFETTALQGLELTAASVPGLPRLGRARLAGALRLERLRATAEPGASLYAAHFLGPVSLVWALWALHRAKRLGLGRLYFLARDAYLAWHCARRLAPEFGVECRYLQVSRKSLALASTPEISRHGLEWMHWTEPPLRLKAALRRLDLTEAELPGLLDALGLPVEADPPLGREMADRVIEVLRRPERWGLVEARIAARRDTARRYLAQEGLLDELPWALVDLGWALTIQRWLCRLLGHTQVHGLYAYISDMRWPQAETGGAEAMLGCVLHDAVEQRSMLRVRATVVSEDLLGPVPHGTVLGWAEEGGRLVPRTAEMAAARMASQQRLCAAVEEFADRNAAAFLAALPDAESCAAAFRALTDAFFQAPAREITAELTDAAEPFDPFNDETRKPLIHPYGWRDAAIEVLPRWRAERLQPPRIWPEGSLAASPPAVQQALRLSAWLRGRLGWE